MDNKTNEIKNLTLLFEINKKLDESLELKDVLGSVLRLIAEYMEMNIGTITILNRETKEIAIEEAYGLSKEQIIRGKYKIGEGITGKVVETGEAIIVPKISEEISFLDRTKSRELLNKMELSFLCVPIKIESEVIGSIGFDKIYYENDNIEADLKIIKLIASLISQAVKLRQSVSEEIENLKEENRYLQEELKVKFKPSNIIGNSKKMKEVYMLIEKVLDNKTTVLIHGESGVGKELVAHAIHYNSTRANGPFIKINCAALSENLIESELFGHEKGSYTNAYISRKGRFELANGGTIFLDEIGDIPQSTQIKLLRVLQEKEIEKVGSNTPIKIDVRVISATNQPLEELVEKGKFRFDLYYRVNIFPIYVPSLKERKDDILLLADYFIEKYSKINNKNIKRISTAVIDMFLSYHWPGNVRELENCIERAVILSSDDVIHGYNLPASLQTATASGTDKIGTLETVVNNIEKDMIIDALKLTNGKILKTAEILGITERKLGLRINKYSINPKIYKKY